MKQTIIGGTHHDPKKACELLDDLNMLKLVRRDVIKLLTKVANGKRVKSYIVDWLDNNVQ